MAFEMTPERWRRAQMLCMEAEDLPAEERGAFLDGECAGDAALREQVDSMLGASAGTQGFLDRSQTPTTGDANPFGSDIVSPGVMLGVWRIGELVGRGGMGEVYEAHRADGTFELKAAVKMLKRGLDTDAVVRRFMRERRILAQLAHPNIGHLLDAGVSPDGRPYLVMEFIEGVPITHYASSHQLHIRDVLRLMMTVCEAVQVAHAKHIVHRDLKPSNILVSPDGQVKLLDFGIAKLIDEEELEQTRVRGDATPFTPEYAAPEQILGNEATTASDVYALGIVLSELLTERLPHGRRGKTPHEITMNLAQETVTRPSQILRRERGRLPEPLRLSRIKEISRDLDLITLKALQFDADRRYATAKEFHDDLQRLMANQPIQARPDSAGYRVSRFVSRNRLAVGAAAAVIVALSVGLAAALWQAQAALAARNDALRRQQQAEELLRFMVVDLRDKLLPLGKLSVLDAVGTKAMDYFSSLDQKDLTDATLGSRATALRQIGDLRTKQGDMKGALDSFGEALKLDETLVKRHPRDTSVIRNVGESQFSMGAAYYAKGEYPQAREWFVRYRDTADRLVKLEPDKPEWTHLLVQALENLGGVTFVTGDLDGARALFASALATHRPLVEAAPDNRLYLTTLAELHGWLHTIDDAQRDWTRALENAQTERGVYQRLHEQDPDDASFRHALVDADLRMIIDEMNLRAVTPDAPMLAEARRLSGQLTRLDPDNMDYAHSHFVSRYLLVEAQMLSGALADAASTSHELLGIARASYERASDKSQAVNDMLGAVLQGAKVAILRDDAGEAEAFLSNPTLQAFTQAQRDAALATRWLDLHLLDWWVHEGTPGAAEARARATTTLDEIAKAGGRVEPELMFRLEALRGNKAEARQWYEELGEVERQQPLVRKVCRSHRVCD